ncbi:hypothetical protein [uncultured Methanoregula sp.]|uniref:hypothetical protein n=1 Tax=uncultured Methanoregula sp. TaxID=1005933 RepID=UPI002AAB2A69|nr:hypothetical protein [uncultured Methanoregula sp.]
MFAEITYAPILGKPLILYLGVLTLLGFLITASVAIMNLRGIHTIPFRWHMRCAAVSIALALVHGSLGILAYW